MFIQFHLDISTIESQDEMDEYAKILRLNPEIFKYKIQYLYSKNDEIFNTLDIRLLSSRMDIFSLEDIERISIYTDIQNLILNKDDNFLKILAKIFQIIDKDSYDISPLIYKILINSDSDKYQSLFKSIKIDNLSNEILENLIYILQNDNNYYEITNIEDLIHDRFNIIRERKKHKEEDFENKKLSLEQIKELLLQEKFNMTMEMANFICTRYCTDMESLNKSQINVDTKRILQSIYIICTSTSYEELKYFYLNTKSTVNEYDAAYLLEAKIRSEFAKLYSDSLYKIKDEHKMQKDKNVNDNVYNALNEIEYKGKKVNFYIMDGDFNMQIHILGAYRYWTNPENYKEDWERPKIAYHGICTSYIGNNQIANARQSHPCYGFDSYEESALLLAGPYDLLSDSSISKYATSINEPYNLYTPEVMINKTRHSHNEMVIERRAKSKIQSFKRLPSYVVYFVDDINNIPNQINDSLFQESIQAAVDNDIPIIIVDRLKYAKSEKKKIDDRINQFKANPNINDLNYIITNYCNNMIGCAYYDTQERCEYHDVFSKEDLENIVKYLYNIIIELPTEDKNKLLVAMNNLINTEQINFQIPNTILNENYNSLFTEIFLIYQNLDDPTKEKIEEDIQNGVQLEIIKKKVENNEYENTTSKKK